MPASRRSTTILSTFLLLAVSLPAAADWVAGRDMRLHELSLNELDNPNSTVPAWSYGFKTPTGTFTLFPAGTHSNTIYGYQGYKGYGDGAVLAVNASNVAVVNNAGFGNLLPVNPGVIFLHPDSIGTQPTVRWTAPAAGQYIGSFQWQDIDPYGGDGGTGHLRLNGTEIQGFAWQNGGGASGLFDLVLASGDTLDFALGMRGNWFHDSTRFDATISAVVVPLPASAWLLAGALAGVVRWGRRRS